MCECPILARQLAAIAQCDPFALQRLDRDPLAVDETRRVGAEEEHVAGSDADLALFSHLERRRERDWRKEPLAAVVPVRTRNCLPSTATTSTESPALNCAVVLTNRSCCPGSKYRPGAFAHRSSRADRRRAFFLFSGELLLLP